MRARMHEPIPWKLAITGLVMLLFAISGVLTATQTSAQDGIPGYALLAAYWPSDFQLKESSGYQGKSLTLVRYYPGVNNNLRNDPYYQIGTTPIMVYPTEQWARELVLDDTAKSLGLVPVGFSHSADRCYRGDVNDAGYAKNVRIFCVAGRGYFWADIHGRKVYDGKTVIKPAPSVDELYEVARAYISGAARYARELSVAPTYEMKAACDYFASGYMTRHPKIAISGNRIWMRFDGTLDNFHYGCGTAEVAEIWEIWEGRITGSGERISAEGTISSRIRLSGGGDYCDGSTQEGTGRFSGSLVDGVFAGKDMRTYTTVAGDVTLMDPVSCNWEIQDFDPKSAAIEPGQVPPWAHPGDSGVAVAPPPGSPANPGPQPLPPPVGPPDGSAGTDGWGDSGTAIAMAAGAAAGAGLAGLGAWLMLGQTGVGRREAFAGLGDLMRGQLPDDGFDAWKAKYEAMGWNYREENGVAVFDPPPGYAEQPPSPDIDMPRHRDGDVNADTGEVWSEEDGGWIGRNLYEQEKSRASDIAGIERRSAERMRIEDEKTRELGRAVADAERQRRELAAIFDARNTLEDEIDRIWQQDLEAGTLGEGRRELLADLERRAEELSLSKDRTGAVDGILGLADIVGHQAREGFKPTYTYRDAIFDTAIQTGAAALDAVLTRGYASTAIGSSLAMRDAAREGKSGTEILYEGAKAAVFDFAIGKSADLVGRAAGMTRTAWREAGEAAEEAGRVASRLKGASQAGGDLLAETERNLNRMRKNLTRDAKGRPRAGLDDVLEVQRTPHQVRNLKQTGTQELQDGFNNTLRSEVYKPHDKALIQRLKENHPDLADRKVVVHEFRTPGKGGSGINTDRDFRVLCKNDSGEWVEVPRSRWEKDSNEIFGELTGYDPAKCPQELSDTRKAEWWAEQHGHTATDRSFREACPDYSDQLINEAGERVRAGKPRILELKEIANGTADLPAQPVRLRDPVSIGAQFDEKIAGNLRRGDPFEAVAQAQKGVDTLDAVRKAYDVQRIGAGRLPENFGKAMDLIRNSNLPAKPDAGALSALQEGLGELGFANLDTFGKALSSQFESLKFAK